MVAAVVFSGCAGLCGLCCLVFSVVFCCVVNWLLFIWFD